MKKFIFLYKGYVTPTKEIGQAWGKWFQEVGDKMVDSGNPMSNGAQVTKNDVTELKMDMEALTGYSIVNAESKEEAIELAKTNPMINSVSVYELAHM